MLYRLKSKELLREVQEAIFEMQKASVLVWEYMYNVIAKLLINPC